MISIQIAMTEECTRYQSVAFPNNDSFFTVHIDRCQNIFYEKYCTDISSIQMCHDSYKDHFDKLVQYGGSNYYVYPEYTEF